MLLSLGDADKFGHANMYRRYLEALHESDKVVAQVAHVLDELRAQGWPSTLLVTADHGRDQLRHIAGTGLGECAVYPYRRDESATGGHLDQ